MYLWKGRISREKGHEPSSRSVWFGSPRDAMWYYIAAHRIGNVLCERSGRVAARPAHLNVRRQGAQVGGPMS